ncbi:hypothetical protein CC53_gp105 [Rhizobium phage vB_RleS_L338C]|uniref:hypothetical protein n=1 Tax=Rhizobium phage vB_RleS_L338C TaxID=1414737 RepID=UPI0003D7C432|nr:hypothetical protein CC53_gp105 [Rhizobium phage vB_RleS_L338C]AHC30522.1 hypothetical protein L338C_105 [Rhizobium phage vB_RleS_L338C]QNH72182.1 hypothetical protein P11VFA_045 [Rhizobium phage P11VFA]
MNIPANLPTSTEVIDLFRAWANDIGEELRDSYAYRADHDTLFQEWIEANHPAVDAAAIIERCKYPL